MSIVLATPKMAITNTIMSRIHSIASLRLAYSTISGRKRDPGLGIGLEPGGVYPRLNSRQGIHRAPRAAYRRRDLVHP